KGKGVAFLSIRRIRKLQEPSPSCKGRPLMLERNKLQPVDVHRLFAAEHERDFIKFRDIKLFLWRYAAFILAFAALGAAGGIFYLATSNPIYTAHTQILIEPKSPPLLQQQSS